MVTGYGHNYSIKENKGKDWDYFWVLSSMTVGGE